MYNSAWAATEAAKIRLVWKDAFFGKQPVEGGLHSSYREMLMPNLEV